MDNRLSRVIERLSSKPSERPRLSGLAQEAGLSVRMLELLFKTQTGKPFAVFYRELRIRLAKELLRKSDAPVKEIASQLGYKAVEVFCRDFKRVSGCTAIEFRRRSRKEKLQKKSID